MRRSAGGRGLGAFEAEPVKLQPFNEHVDDPDPVVLSDVVVQALWQQGDLTTLFTFDESLHAQPVLSRCDNLDEHPQDIKTFSHGLDP